MLWVAGYKLAGKQEAAMKSGRRGTISQFPWGR